MAIKKKLKIRSFFCLQKNAQKNYERDEERSETYTKEMKNVLFVTILTASALFGTIRCEDGDAASSGCVLSNEKVWVESY